MQDLWLVHLSYVLLVAAMLMRSMKSLRILALLSGFAALVYLFFNPGDTMGLVWTVLFVAVNGVMLALLLFGNRRGAMTGEERELLENVLRVEEPAQQRRLLDVMTWRDADEGEVLMTQGQKAPPLIYIASGAAGIESDGKLVGVCGPGDFLGEMSLITGENASATVRVTNPVRIASFDLDALDRLKSAMPELARAFDHALNSGLAAKILRMNKAAAPN